MQTICCVCRKLKVNGEYIEAEATDELISHGYCKECVTKEKRKYMIQYEEKIWAPTEQCHNCKSVGMYQYGHGYDAQYLCDVCGDWRWLRDPVVEKEPVPAKAIYTCRYCQCEAKMIDNRNRIYCEHCHTSYKWGDVYDQIEEELCSDGKT